MATTQGALARRDLEVDFSGRAGEYFRIWFPNLLLTLVTLGIYGPWAKVRNTQYIYGHTYIDGASFEYTARPLDILKGRLIAVGILAIFTLASRFEPLLELVLFALLLLVIPWLVVSALRFRMRNTRYRNVRFEFGGGVARAFLEFFVIWLAVVVTAGLAYPYVRWRQSRYVLGNTAFGGAQFRFRAPLLDYYLIYALPVLLVIAIFLVLVVALALLAPVLSPVALDLDPGAGPDEGTNIAVYGLLLGNLLVYLAAVFVALYVTAHTRNLLFNTATLERHRFGSRVGAGRLLWLWAGNVLALIFSLGLAWPWVRVRMARYYANCTRVRAAGDLNSFIGRRESESRALGEEMGEVFDFDVGL